MTLMIHLNLTSLAYEWCPPEYLVRSPLFIIYIVLSYCFFLWFLLHVIVIVIVVIIIIIISIIIIIMY